MNALLSNLGKPDQGMHMVRHDHKPQTDSLVMRQATPQLANHDSLGKVREQIPSAFVAGERHKVDVLLIIVDTSFDHRSDSLPVGHSLPEMDTHDEASCRYATRPTKLAGPPCEGLSLVANRKITEQTAFNGTPRDRNTEETAMTRRSPVVERIDPITL